MTAQVLTAYSGTKTPAPAAFDAAYALLCLFVAIPFCSRGFAPLQRPSAVPGHLSPITYNDPRRFGPADDPLQHEEHH